MYNSEYLLKISIIILLVFIIITIIHTKMSTENSQSNNVNVCLNYYGQLRDINRLKEMYYKYIHIIENDLNNQNVKYHVIYTTWNTEDVSGFKEFFPNSYIEQIDQPNMENYNYLIDKYKIDVTNSHKSMDHYVKGMYVKQMTCTTIKNLENINNINFDFIVTLRTDIYINKYLPSYYDIIINDLEDDTVYVPNEPKFAIYQTPALPDVITISNKKVTEKVLNQLSILEHCTVNGSNFFHPETSFYNCLKYFDLNIVELDFKAFPQPI